MKNFLVYLFSGILLSLGLAMSGMYDRFEVLRFLNFSDPDQWSDDLFWVLMSAMATYFFLYWFCLPKKERDGLEAHKRRAKITKSLIMGSSVFGLGWGLAGLCPAPLVAYLGHSYFDGQVWIMVIVMFVGLYLGGIAARRLSA